MDSTVDNSIWFKDFQRMRTDFSDDTLLTKKINEHFAGFKFLDKTLTESSLILEDTELSPSNEFEVASNDLDLLSELPMHNFYKDPDVITNEYLKMKGYVTNIGESSFEGRLISDEGGTYEVVEFDNIEISEEDLPLFKEGAIFYWTFGLFTYNKTRRKVSEVRFQRIAPLNTNEFDQLIDEADKLNEAIDWD